MLSWFVKTIRSGARAADGSLPADVWTEGVVHPTLNLFDVGDTRAVTLVIHWNPIDEGVVGPLTTGMDSPRGSETSDSKHLVIGEEEEVSSVFPIQNTVIGRKDTAGPQGRGHGDADGPMFTLDTGGGHAVAVAEEEKNYKQPVASTVRRLTPVECERLQGFPDDWTMADAKTVDSHRYKQMGNAVTVNVIGWIGSRL
jgi:site-specific DNA-cytosine methylase